jgi:hypothetical protein
VDSTYRGIYFGGLNPNTYLKATEFHHHYNGLYLNNTAVISSQTLYGNRWNNTSISFQAYNANTQGFQLSTFFVDTIIGSVYMPVNNIQGWFSHLSGNTFRCSNSLVCSTTPVTLTDSLLNAMIANGTLETNGYVNESKAIAEEYLFRQLKEDSVLIEQDSVYAAFMAEKTGDATEYLYDAEEYLRVAYNYDSVYINLIDSAKQQIELLADSINCIRENSCSGDVELLTTEISFLYQTIRNIEILREASMTNNLINARLINDIVLPDNLPQENAKIMNEIEANYLESGNSVQYLSANYSEIYSIAQQCPYAGGPAVEKARSFIALLNDTMAYNDDARCLQNGIFRLADDTIRSVVPNQIIVQPNPANNEVSIILKGNFEGLCYIQIKNAMGEEILFSQMNCVEKQKVIDVSNFAQGVYSVKINVNNITFLSSKLVIIR